jgi:glyoxylase-like metal-dependent hydrolase (beta-lactamase superfamily II)
LFNELHFIVQNVQSMRIRPFYDEATGTFTYLVDDAAGACAVIDPVMGFDVRSGRRDLAPVRKVADLIETEGLRLEWILETHVHADHLSSGPWLQQRLGGKLAIGEHITRVQRLFRGIYNATDVRPDGSQFDRLLRDGETLSIGNLTVMVMHVPGHTPADVAYRVRDPSGQADAVFVGDTLFMPSVGTARCDFPGGDARTLFRSSRRLLSLAPATRLYVCHDYPAAGAPARHVATVGEHRASNVHVRDGIDQDEFVTRRSARDATLAPPQLMLPAVQVNMRAGHLPPADDNGTVYLRIPVDRL